MTKMTLAFCLLLAFSREPDPSYKLVSAPGNTYGYDIYLHGPLPGQLPVQYGIRKSHYF
jgi:hypothetical protein